VLDVTAARRPSASVVTTPPFSAGEVKPRQREVRHCGVGLRRLMCTRGYYIPSLVASAPHDAALAHTQKELLWHPAMFMLGYCSVGQRMRYGSAVQLCTLSSLPSFFSCLFLFLPTYAQVNEEKKRKIKAAHTNTHADERGDTGERSFGLPSLFSSL
jgi:hypothetical protein